jgi:hypothetical protein
MRRYLAASAVGHLAWEFAHMPLYTLWASGTLRDIVLGALHCTGGDLLIAIAALTGALVVAGTPHWPAARSGPVAALAIAAGVGYTAFSEWLNTSVRGAWTYSDLMPIVAIGDLRLGLSPLVQWIIVPGVALGLARRAR